MINIIRGISFSINNEKKVLYQILKCIDIDKYYWYSIDEQNEVWTNKMGNENVFFDKYYYDGKTFKNKIQSDCFVIFFKVQAYLKKCNFNNIHTLQEFLQSECQILLLIYDCSFVEIFAKNENILNDFYNNALNNSYTNVRYITDENNSRTKMDIL